MSALTIEIAGRAWRAELDGDAAPRTVAAVTARLPGSFTAYHGFATGMALTVPLEAGLELAENSHVFGAPAGSVMYFPNLNGRVLDGARTTGELVITYGITRFFDWTGYQACSLIGRVVDVEASALLELGSEVRRNGATPISLGIDGS